MLDLGTPPAAAADASLPPAPAAAAAFAVDTLWRVLVRQDGYVTTTNIRAGTFVSFNTFVVSGVILTWKSVLGQYAEPADAGRWAVPVAGALLAVIAAAALVSLWFVFRTITPYTGRAAHAAAERSLVYYADVRRFAGEAEYVEAARRLTPDALARDLALQARGLGFAVLQKFADLRRATLAIVYAVIPALAGLVVLKLYLTLHATLSAAPRG